MAKRKWAARGADTQKTERWGAVLVLDFGKSVRRNGAGREHIGHRQ